MPSLEQVRRKLEMERRRRDNLVLLVGRNPIPNFVAASVLQPRTVYMVFTEDTKDVKNRLVRSLQTYVSWNSEPPCFIDVQLVNVCNADEVRRVVSESIPAGSALHYTGGMKTMAAHVYYFWRQSHDDLRLASYLDEASGTLWFDDGLSEDVDGAAPLSLKALSNLHGLSDFSARFLPAESSIKGNPTINDAVAIVKGAVNDPEGISRLTNGLLRCLNEGCTYGGADFASRIFSELSCVEPLPVTNTTIQNIRDQWSGFIKYHGWLELFTAHSVAEAGKQLNNEEGHEHGETCWDVKAKTVAGRCFQVDVTHRRGHRLYALSCTVSRDLKDSKIKLFEVSLRARQLGGDYARSAVVSFINGDHQRELQADVMTAYGPIDEKGNRRVAHVPRVFGVDHIRAWLDGNLGSLKDWLRA